MKGLLQVYTGDGKGKTTAALGLALRAAGQNFQVVFIQFMKEGAVSTGETKALERLAGIEHHRFGKSFIYSPKPTLAEVSEAVHRGLALAADKLKNHECDLLILDEIMAALHHGAVSLTEVLGLIDARPDSVELVLTGRDCPPEIIERADLVTCMTVIKHPYEQGIAARRGIEY